MSNSSRTPVPSAVMRAWISWFWRTLSMRAFSTLRILPRSGSTACVLRSRPCLAEPPAESPSTMKSSASEGSFTEQSASLPGSVEFSSADLRGRDRRADDRVGLRGVLLEELPEAVGDDRAPEPLHAGVAELRLRLALELRVGELRREDGGQPLADVLAGEVVVALLQEAARLRVAVEHGRQRRPEARQVRAALVRVD